MDDENKFGNWQEFLDDAVQKIQKDAKQLERFKSLRSDVERIAYAEQIQTQR